MPLLSPLELKTQLKTSQRLMGLDLGGKTIGIALSDMRFMVATPYETIHRVKFKPDARQIIKVIQEYEVQALVMGWPLNMDGSEGPRCQSTKQFVKNFLSFHDMPIILWDERLSTKAMEDVMISFDVSRSKRADAIDKAAASFILQGFLESLRF
jgi:putative Holliday junction resolvase